MADQDILHEELMSNAKRNVNSLKEKEVSVRKNAILELTKMVRNEKMDPQDFQQLMHMGLKEFVRCYYDTSEFNREHSVLLTIDLLSRCKTLSSFLPYIMEALKDRTNCVDLEGIDKLPEKLRPHPGQKPKVMLKLTQNCQEIRILYCTLIKRIISLIDKDRQEMLRHLDDVVNILRALIMDPAPEIQRNACETLELFCQDFKDILLHFTETMGRAVLLPLISKKSKIRVAALNALTAVLWCGLWKYNAFVFQNLIGFRDPNSVPIKDFYEPSNNVNYLATFIIDPNVKVRQEFMKNIKIWVCDLNDKFDHHGRLVPYLLSGLFDEDQSVKEIAHSTIIEIGKQIEEEKQKEFRENKQFAIDSAWTWEGKIVNLPIEEPLFKRPSLGSRFFIRGHVRKFWPALYKEIRDIKEENRIRAANLALYGVIFTQNYLTQYLDKMIPNFLPSILPFSPQQKLVSQRVAKIFYYIGRYCEQSAYLHLMESALEGKLIQNEEFIKCAMKGFSMMVSGNLDAIPEGQSLCHKVEDIIRLLNILQDCQIAGDVYNFNCVEAQEIAICIISGIQAKGNETEKQRILSVHFPTLMKLLCVSSYEQIYSVGFFSKSLEAETEKDSSKEFSKFMKWMQTLEGLYSDHLGYTQQYLEKVFCDPPSLMDSDWKILIILYRYFSLKGSSSQDYHVLLLLIQDAICECLSKNKSIQILTFISKFQYNLVFNHSPQEQITELTHSTKLTQEILKNLSGFQAMKKVPVYDQHLLKEDKDLIKASEENFISVFNTCSSIMSSFYIQKIPIPNQSLAMMLSAYFGTFRRIIKNKDAAKTAVKTVWAIFQKMKIEEGLSKTLIFHDEEKNEVAMMPQIIDFAVQRLEEYFDSKLVSMVFGIMQNLVKSWPLAKSIMTKMPDIYPAYGDLLQKLFKYTLNEKDVDTRQKYQCLLKNMCKKLPEWFKVQQKMAKEAKRYEKAKLVQEVMKDANL